MARISTLKIRYTDLVAATDSEAEAEAIWTKLRERTPDPFGGRTFVTWVAGVLALVAVTVFVGDAWVRYGLGSFTTLLVMVMAALAILAMVLDRQSHHLPAGLIATVVVALVPFLVFNLTELAGIARTYDDYHSFYVWISSQWVLMEVATIAAGVVALRLIDFGLLTLPPSVAAYFLAMDLGEHFLDLGDRTSAIAVGFGLGIVMVATGVLFDRHERGSHATWLLLFGLGSLLVGAGEVTTGTAAATLYLMLGLSFIGLGWAIRRGIPITVGGLTAVCSLGYFAWEIFEGSIAFTLVLLVMALGLMAGATFLPHSFGADTKENPSGREETVGAQRLGNHD